MKKPQYNRTEGSAWLKGVDACNHLHMSRATLEKLSAAANAKRKFGRNAFYNVKRIEEFLDASG